MKKVIILLGVLWMVGIMNAHAACFPLSFNAGNAKFIANNQPVGGCTYNLNIKQNTPAAIKSFQYNARSGHIQLLTRDLKINPTTYKYICSYKKSYSGTKDIYISQK